MENLLFPNWMLFSGSFLFLKIYNPTRLYLDNFTCLAIAAAIAIFLDASQLGQSPTLSWVIAVVIFAMFSSVPYWLSGTVGSVIQQLLLLNEQSVQDKRFTDESEALAKMSSLIFLIYALQSGELFRPIISMTLYNDEISLSLDFESLFFLITDSLKVMVIVAGKYVVIMLMITVCCGYVDLFFKKASLSLFVTPNIKAIVVVILLNLWLFSDQFYVFKQMMQKVGYD
ncbi:type III secretion system apparatus protein VscT2 [Vibrio mediterranei]|uniref:Type III secretion system apparatus protein VscT2 n=1 Tax=Vibrio mediterranei TaxID=689 RepID=A0A3G4VJS5_9VIBR|nr:type III secretion system apparatus protein VscT2 [Vibrio mediterranei]AYV25057.1 type III secretion system apparatus protein VscT2 [Vibrio mediterranei]MCG9790523.1 type III secretion system apparatus protein VscT2 [Vibrio mediterranei]